MENTVTATGFGEAFQYLSGFLFVLLVLFILWLVIETIGLTFRNREKKKAAALSEAEQLPSTSTPHEGKQDDQLAEEHLVVIASTVALMLGSRHRLVSIRKTSANWGREGRREHYHSHTIR